MKTINRILFFSGLAMLVFVGNSCEPDDIDPNDYRFSCFIDGKVFVLRIKKREREILTSPFCLIRNLVDRLRV